MILIAAVATFIVYWGFVIIHFASWIQNVDFIKIVFVLLFFIKSKKMKDILCNSYVNTTILELEEWIHFHQNISLPRTLENRIS